LHLLMPCVILYHSKDGLCFVLMFAHDSADCVTLYMEGNDGIPCWE